MRQIIQISIQIARITSIYHQGSDGIIHYLRMGIQAKGQKASKKQKLREKGKVFHVGWFLFG
jgi:hypothetical protein